MCFGGSCETRILAVFEAVPDGGGAVCPASVDHLIAVKCGDPDAMDDLVVCVQEGQDLLVMVAAGPANGQNPNPTIWEISFWFWPNPTNVSCTTAEDIEPGVQEPVHADCVDEVWYTFTPEAAGRVTVETCGSDYATEARGPYPRRGADDGRLRPGRPGYVALVHQRRGGDSAVRQGYARDAGAGRTTGVQPCI